MEPTAQETERRVAERFQLEGTVDVLGARGVTRDVSRLGTYFELGRPLAAESDVEITLSLPESAAAEPVVLACAAEVVRVEPIGPHRWGVAVAFRHLSFGSASRSDAAPQTGNEH